MEEIGWSESNGMGMSPISWQTIDAWAKLTQTPILPEEALLLRQLSKTFVGSYNNSKSPNAPCPVAVQSTEEQQNALREQMMASLRNRKSSKK